MQSGDGGTLRRGLLWGLLAGALLAIVVAAVMSRRWAEEGSRQPPPVLAPVPDFTLVNRDDREVSLADLRGEPWVADFIFTRCALSCPLMTSRMMRLGAALAGEGGVRRVSFTVDPEYDSPQVLTDYAAAYGIADPDWLYLTGEKEGVYELIIDGFRLALDDAPLDASEDEPIVHSTRFVLVDGEGRIRGYYDAFDDVAFERLVEDTSGLLAGS